MIDKNLLDALCTSGDTEIRVDGEVVWRSDTKADIRTALSAYFGPRPYTGLRRTEEGTDG